MIHPHFRHMTFIERVSAEMHDTHVYSLPNEGTFLSNMTTIYTMIMKSSEDIQLSVLIKARMEFPLYQKHFPSEVLYFF